MEFFGETFLQKGFPDLLRKSEPNPIQKTSNEWKNKVPCRFFVNLYGTFPWELSEPLLIISDGTENCAESGKDSGDSGNPQLFTHGQFFVGIHSGSNLLFS